MDSPRMGLMADCALAAGVTGWILARSGTIYIVGPLTSKLSFDRHAPFLADAWAHSASYLVGFVGGIVLAVRVWRARRAGAVPVTAPSP